ncbi:MAG: molybdenum cofactor biosynthesis protein MoaE [Phycisphaerae bacterium]
MSADNSAANARVDATLSHELIDVPAMTRQVEHSGIGAVASFVGVVRSETNSAGARLAALEYTAYEAMAVGEMRRIAEQTAARYAIHAARLAHRLGRLDIGTASVAVVVSAPHRAAAFDACREIIEELKRSVPIFKREIWAEGAATWVE